MSANARLCNVSYAINSCTICYSHQNCIFQYNCDIECKLTWVIQCHNQSLHLGAAAESKRPQIITKGPALNKQCMNS